MNTIIVKQTAHYKDGGTRQYRDKKGNEFYLDNRIGSKTKGKVFDRYPSENGARMLNVKLVGEVKQEQYN